MEKGKFDSHRYYNYDLVLYFSKEICLSYKYKIKHGLPICKFPRNAIATNIDCDTESDGSKNCIIKDPNHSNLNRLSTML